MQAPLWQRDLQGQSLDSEAGHSMLERPPLQAALPTITPMPMLPYYRLACGYYPYPPCY